MKLVIQIPCYNEAGTLARTIEDIPKEIPGIDELKILIIDDGSTDDTVEIARKMGAEVLSMPYHQGLAHAFASGIRHALSMGADIIVNTDGDNQYQGRFISNLIQPVIKGDADMVIGCRPFDEIEHFSRIKTFLQKAGSRVVQFLTGVKIPDVTTGFRAYSRTAARRMKIFSDFTYTVETLIQAAKSGLRVATVPIKTNPPTRPSRLFRGNWYYVRKQTGTILRVWALYSPVKLFSRSGFICLVLGSALFFRFFYYYLISWPEPSGKVQSLLIAAIFFIFGFFLILIGVLADLIGVNRRLIEELHDRAEIPETSDSRFINHKN